MKKLILPLAMLSSTVTAQITLEHTYNTYVGGLYDNGSIGYSTYEQSSRTWKHYDDNHSLIRTIVIPEVSGFTNAAPSYYGRNRFANSNEFMYMVQYNGQQGDTRIKIFSETGTMHFSESCTSCYGQILQVNGSEKLIINSATFGKIYSLPGTWLGIAPTDGGGQEFRMYPNPTAELVTINATEAGSVVLFNSIGQEVARYSIQTPGSISFSVQHLQAGVYMVRVNDQLTERLVVR